MLARKAMKAILFSPLRIQRTDILSKRPIARFQDLHEDLLLFFLIRIDFNSNHFVISLVLATLPYGKANEIE